MKQYYAERAHYWEAVYDKPELKSAVGHRGKNFRYQMLGNFRLFEYEV